MAELSATWWKKNKAKTLLREPLTKVLEEYDKCDQDRRRHGYAEHVEMTTQALSLVLKAIEETKTKCSDKHHEATKGYLDDMAKLANGARKQLKAYQDDIKGWLAQVATAVTAWEAAWRTVLASPSVTNLTAFGAASDAAHQILVSQEQPYPNVGEFFGTAGGTMFRYAELQKTDVPNLIGFANRIAAGDANAHVELMGGLREVTTNMSKIPGILKQMRGMV